MNKTSLALAVSLCCALTACQQTQQQMVLNDVVDHQFAEVTQAIPSPAQMSVDIVASGRVSTLKHIDIVKVGKQIPYTYSDGKITNSPGFNWWVSKHFALKSDRPEDQVKLYLELLEMSYPHYKELFGAEPANIENQRIAAVYGSSKKDTKIFVTDDGLQRGISAGGEAMFYNLAGYSFPSAREQHQRYIVIHEQGHAFQMALMDYPGWLPTWFTEGTADALAHHYYDPKKKQLKVMVFDRGSPMDYIRLGLKEYHQLKQPSIQDMTTNPQLYRGINFLIVHFMLDDPKRSHLFKAYRDEMANKRRSDYTDGKELSHQLMADIFGDWPQVERDFADYVQNVNKTFNIAAGPWEQDGNQYWVRTLNNSYEHGSPRMDLYLKPGDKPQYQPFKFDQPMAEKSALIGEVNRGGDTPSLAIEIDYQADHLHRGYAGIALGIHIPEASQKLIIADNKAKQFGQRAYNPNDDHFLGIKLNQGETLIVNGESIGAANISYALPFELIADLESQSNPKLGVQVTIEQKALKFTIKSANQQFVSHYPISQQTREKLLTRHIGVMSENAQHRITPYFDDGRDLNPQLADLSHNADVNPWRNPADGAISRLTRAIWRLADKSPAALKRLNDEMIAATTQGVQAQRASLNRFNQQLDMMVQAILSSGQDRERINQALIELSGLSLRMEWRQESADGRREVAAVLNNTSEQPATAVMNITQQQNAQQQNAKQLQTRVLSGQKQQVSLTTSAQTRASSEKINATTEVDWLGATIHLTAVSDARPYPWSSMAIVQQAISDGETVSIVSEFRGPHAGTTKGKLRVEAYPSHLFEQSVIELAVDIKPYEIRQFTNQLQLKPGAMGQPYAVDVSFAVEIDGEAVLLKQRSAVLSSKELSSQKASRTAGSQ